MVAAADQNCDFEARCKDIDRAQREYHFRDFGNGHIMWCIYATGGNGGFCTRITSKQVDLTDKAAEAYCASQYSAGYPTPPHAVYGELWDLDYRCVGSRATRLSVDMALDHDGYVRRQWSVLAR